MLPGGFFKKTKMHDVTGNSAAWTTFFIDNILHCRANRGDNPVAAAN